MLCAVLVLCQKNGLSRKERGHLVSCLVVPVLHHFMSLCLGIGNSNGKYEHMKSVETKHKIACTDQANWTTSVVSFTRYDNDGDTDPVTAGK
jgi:hypothetical protein